MGKPKIFISSTIEDLQSEREIAKTVLEERFGNIFDVVLLEQSRGLGKTPREFCNASALECTIFVGIYGEKYGTILKDEEKSITEYEYDVAKNDDPEKILPYIKTIQKETKQSQFINKIEDFDNGQVRKSFKTFAELVEHLEKDIPAWISEKLSKKKKTTQDLEINEKENKGLKLFKGKKEIKLKENKITPMDVSDNDFKQLNILKSGEKYFVDSELKDGTKAHYELDKEGNANATVPNISEYSIEVLLPKEDLISSNETELGKGSKQTILKFKWGFELQTITDTGGKLQSLSAQGGKGIVQKTISPKNKKIYIYYAENAKPKSE